MKKLYIVQAKNKETHRIIFKTGDRTKGDIKGKADERQTKISDYRTICRIIEILCGSIESKEHKIQLQRSARDLCLQSWLAFLFINL